MSLPTPDQQRVLEGPAPRVRVVRAAPGSGKTWLVAELIRQELESWQSPTGGIAALSFTRIGGAEIRRALGYELGHPHFVGTIDAFLFRHIVRPFLTKCFPALATPRLIPGEWRPQQWGKYGQSFSATTKTGINVFGCVFIGEENGRATISYAKPFQPLARLVGDEEKEVRQAKRDLWTRSGCLTHSDAALWASKILESTQYGSVVAAEVIRRFPLIVVDEVQDTGYFLGKALRILLDCRTARGVVVGDPDQAIYEFNGARPDLFKGFEQLSGAVELPLTSSLRCPPAIAIAASHLKDSGGSVGPAQLNSGRVLLLRGSDLATEIDRLIEASLKTRSGDVVKVITRQNTSVELLSGQSAKPFAKLGSPSLTHMTRAVVSFRRGKQVSALAGARSALEYSYFGFEGISDDLLEQRGITVQDWKRLAVESLLVSNELPTNGSLYDWQSTVGAVLEKKLADFCAQRSLEYKTGKLKPKKNSGWSKPCSSHVPPVGVLRPKLKAVPVTTVHAVKGETHNVTVFVCPDPSEEEWCLSNVWWSAKDDHREEKRIAYVAMTRTRGHLILWIGPSSYDRLTAARPEFMSSLELVTIDDAISLLMQAGVSA